MIPYIHYPVNNRADKFKHKILEVIAGNCDIKTPHYAEFHSGSGQYNLPDGIYDGSAIRVMKSFGKKQYTATLHEIRDEARSELERNVSKYPATVRNNWMLFAGEYIRDSNKDWIILSDPNICEEYTNTNNLLINTLTRIVGNGSLVVIYVPQQTNLEKNAKLHQQIHKQLTTEITQKTGREYLDLAWSHTVKDQHPRKDHLIIYCRKKLHPTLKNAFIEIGEKTIPNSTINFERNKIEIKEK